MTKEEHIEYWVKTAEHDIATAQSLFDTGHYDWCLFIGHLVLEKILKAHYVNNTGEVPPKIHDLVRLASKTKLPISENQKNFLEKVNDFLIEARYPDEKLEFYKTCTKEFTDKNLQKIKDIYQWLKSNLKY
jgi:HEPN domain-containing protein